MRWRFAPRFRYGAAAPRCEWRHHVPVATSGAEAIAICNWDAGRPAWVDQSVHARFDIAAGGRAMLSLATAYAEPLVLPSRAAVAGRLARTVAFWESWAATLAYHGPWAQDVVRSALVLKLLIFAPSGASVASPTTSLPEVIGGERNWDYRFCWIRDSNFLIAALLQLGCVDEASRGHDVRTVIGHGQ